MSHVRRWGIGLPIVLALSISGGLAGQAAFAADRVVAVVEPTPTTPVVEAPPAEPEPVEPEPVIVPPVVEPEPEPEPPPPVVTPPVVTPPVTTPTTPPVTTPPVTTPPVTTPTTPPVTTPTKPPVTTPVTPPVAVPTTKPTSTAAPIVPVAGTPSKPVAQKTTTSTKPVPVPATVYEATDTVIIAPSAPQIPVPTTTPAPTNLWEEPLYAAGSPGPADTTAVTALLGSLVLLIALGLALLARAIVLRMRRLNRPKSRQYSVSEDEARLVPQSAGVPEFTEFDQTVRTGGTVFRHPGVIGPPPPPQVL